MLLISQQNRADFHQTCAGKPGLQNRLPPAARHKNSLNNYFSKVTIPWDKLGPGGHHPLCCSAPWAAATRPRALLASPALAGRHGRARAAPTVTAPCPGRHSMTQLSDPTTPSSWHKDIPATLTPLLGSDRHQSPSAHQNPEGWEAGGGTNAGETPPSSFYINKSCFSSVGGTRKCQS